MKTDNGDLGKPVWQKEGQKGNFWIFGHLFIENKGNNLRIVVEGVVGNGYMGDIGLDDFSYNDAFLIPIVALWSDIIRRSLVGLRALIPFYSILVNDPVYVISSVTNDICRSSNYPWNNVFNS